MLEQSQIAVEYWRDRLKVINKKKKIMKSKYGMNGFDWDDLEGQVENINAMLESTKIMVKTCGRTGQADGSGFQLS